MSGMAANMKVSEDIEACLVTDIINAVIYDWLKSVTVNVHKG